MRMPLVEIEKACATKDIRMYLLAPWLFVEEKKLVATNGGAMAVVDVEIEDGDVSGPVPVAAIKHARKVAGRKADEMVLACGPDDCTAPDGTSFRRPWDNGRFPSEWRRLIPVPEEELPDFVLNAALLDALAQALHVPSGKAEFNLPNRGVSLWCGRKPNGELDITKAIRVETRDSGYVGVIMPMRL